MASGSPRLNLFIMASPCADHDVLRLIKDRYRTNVSEETSSYILCCKKTLAHSTSFNVKPRTPYTKRVPYRAWLSDSSCLHPFIMALPSASHVKMHLIKINTEHIQAGEPLSI